MSSKDYLNQIMILEEWRLELVRQVPNGVEPDVNAYRQLQNELTRVYYRGEVQLSELSRVLLRGVTS